MRPRSRSRRSPHAFRGALALVALAAVVAGCGAGSPALPGPMATETVTARAVPTASHMPPPEPRLAPVTFSAVGDLCFMDSGRNPLGDPAELLAQVSDHLVARDIAFGNLETALSNRGAPIAKKYTFGAPTSAAASLAAVGFDVLSLANNHFGDFGADASADTVQALASAGLLGVGAGLNPAEPWAPKLLEAPGLDGYAPPRIAFLAFTDVTPESFPPAEAPVGNAYTEDLAVMVNAVAAAQGLGDHLVVSMHWGIERQFEPSVLQVAQAHALVDAGADVVLGHHPHVIEGIEFYNGALIVYSMGNFVFSPGSAVGRDTYVLDFTLTPDGVTDVAAYPAYISGARPHFAEGSEFKRIAGLIDRKS
ncbi:MAG: CapA family protein, partial [Bifidobacteriaceae bacterium]|nr:CapA family protein [Bifidobacteriaceae bacterium]